MVFSIYPGIALRIFSSGSHVILTFEFQVTYIVTINQFGQLLPSTVVLAEGRIYHVVNAVFQRKHNTSLSPVFHPLPQKSEMPATVSMYILGTKMNEIFTDYLYPCTCSHFCSKESLDFKREFECREFILRHYIECRDKEAAIKFYGEKNIEQFVGESLKQMRERLDGLLKEKGEHGALQHIIFAGRAQFEKKRESVYGPKPKSFMF